MNLNKKSGFTLLEIIVVIIIVGVLASLALPQFFSTVEYSKSAEALANLAQIRKAMDRCRFSNNNDYTGCTVTTIDIADPSTAPGNRFVYTNGVTTASDFTIIATRNAVDGGDNSSQITLTANLTTTPSVSRAGSGVFAGIR